MNFGVHVFFQIRVFSGSMGLAEPQGRAERRGSLPGSSGSLAQIASPRRGDIGLPSARDGALLAWLGGPLAGQPNRLSAV